MLFTTKEEQKAYVEREMQMENDNVRPYLLKSHVIGMDRNRNNR